MYIILFDNVFISSASRKIDSKLRVSQRHLELMKKKSNYMLLLIIMFCFISKFSILKTISSFRISKQNGAIFITEIAFKISQNSCYDIIIIYLFLSL